MFVFNFASHEMKKFYSIEKEREREKEKERERERERDRERERARERKRERERKTHLLADDPIITILSRIMMTIFFKTQLRMEGPYYFMPVINPCLWLLSNTLFCLALSFYFVPCGVSSV